MDKVYRVGVVGCGGMGNHHAKWYQASERTELVAAADINAEKLGTFAETYGVAQYADYGEMFARERLDIVCISTWQNVQGQIRIPGSGEGDSLVDTNEAPDRIYRIDVEVP